MAQHCVGLWRIDGEELDLMIGIASILPSGPISLAARLSVEGTYSKDELPTAFPTGVYGCALFCPLVGEPLVGNGPNTVSESTVSNTELSEFFWAHRVPGSELSEFLSAYYLCAKANSPSFSQNSPSLPQNSVSSLFRNSTLETVFRPFPNLESKTPLK